MLVVVEQQPSVEVGELKRAEYRHSVPGHSRRAAIHGLQALERKPRSRLTVDANIPTGHRHDGTLDCPPVAVADS